MEKIILDYKSALMISRIECFPLEYFVGGKELNGVMYFLPSRALKDYHNLRCKKNRYKDILNLCLNVAKSFNLGLYFVTFTLDDKYIKNDKKTILRKIKGVLKEIGFFKYILNEDYGRTTQRLHFHCILFTFSNVSIIKNLYTYGYCDIANIDVSKCIHNIGNYLAKFEKHAYKNTIKLVYSRFNYNHLSYLR